MSNQDIGESLRLLALVEPWDYGDDAVNLILDGIESDRAADRIAALDLVHHVMDPTIADKVVEIIRTDPDPEVRARAVIALGPALQEFDEESGYLDDDLVLDEERFKEVCSLLHTVYQRPEASKLERRRVLEASVRAPQPWHATAVRDAFREADRDWRVTAVFCMGFLKGFDDSILEALDSAVPEIRYEAVMAAGNAYVSGSAPTLFGIAADDDADRDLRVAAILALPNVAGSEATPILDELLDHPDEEIADAVEEAIGEIEVWRELEELEGTELELLDEEDNEDTPF